MPSTSWIPKRKLFGGLEIRENVTPTIQHIQENQDITSEVQDTPTDGQINKPISSNWAYDHEAIGEHSEIKFTPKASSTGAEGTVFYDSDDDHLYVATE